MGQFDLDQEDLFIPDQIFQFGLYQTELPKVQNKQGRHESTPERVQSSTKTNKRW